MLTIVRPLPPAAAEADAEEAPEAEADAEDAPEAEADAEDVSEEADAPPDAYPGGFGVVEP